MKIIKDGINDAVWMKTSHNGYPLHGNPVPWKLWHLQEYMDEEAEKVREKK